MNHNNDNYDGTTNSQNIFNNIYMNRNVTGAAGVSQHQSQQSSGAAATGVSAAEGINSSSNNNTNYDGTNNSRNIFNIDDTFHMNRSVAVGAGESAEVTTAASNNNSSNNNSNIDNIMNYINNKNKNIIPKLNHNREIIEVDLCDSSESESESESESNTADDTTNGVVVGGLLSPTGTPLYPTIQSAAAASAAAIAAASSAIGASGNIFPSSTSIIARAAAIQYQPPRQQQQPYIRSIDNSTTDSSRDNTGYRENSMRNSEPTGGYSNSNPIGFGNRFGRSTTGSYTNYSDGITNPSVGIDHNVNANVDNGRKQSTSGVERTMPGHVSSPMIDSHYHTTANNNTNDNTNSGIGNTDTSSSSFRANTNSIFDIHTVLDNVVPTILPYVPPPVNTSASILVPPSSSSTIPTTATTTVVPPNNSTTTTNNSTDTTNANNQQKQQTPPPQQRIQHTICHAAFAIPIDVKEIVVRAVSLVINEMKTGAWVVHDTIQEEPPNSDDDGHDSTETVEEEPQKQQQQQQQESSEDEGADADDADSEDDSTASSSDDEPMKRNRSRSISRTNNTNHRPRSSTYASRCTSSTNTNNRTALNSNNRTAVVGNNDNPTQMKSKLKSLLSRASTSSSEPKNVDDTNGHDATTTAHSTDGKQNDDEPKSAAPTVVSSTTDEHDFLPKAYLTNIQASLTTTAGMLEAFALDVLLPTFQSVGGIGDDLDEMMELDNSNNNDHDDCDRDTRNEDDDDLNSSSDDESSDDEEDEEEEEEKKKMKREALEKRRDAMIDAVSQRVFVAALLALREVLALNADSIFYIGANTSTSTGTSCRGMKRKRTEDMSGIEKEEDVWKAQLLSTGLILSALHKIGGLEDIDNPTTTASSSPYQVATVELTKQFKSALSKYDDAHEEFTSCLHRADGRSMGVSPDGRIMGNGENVAWRVSYNSAREEHPLLVRSRKRDVVDRSINFVKGERKSRRNNSNSTVRNTDRATDYDGDDDDDDDDDGSGGDIGEEDGFPQPKLTRYVTLPDANACVVAVVEKVTCSDVEEMDLLEAKAEEDRICRQKEEILTSVRRRQKQRRAAQVANRQRYSNEQQQLTDDSNEEQQLIHILPITTATFSL